MPEPKNANRPTAAKRKSPRKPRRVKREYLTLLGFAIPIRDIFVIVLPVVALLSIGGYLIYQANQRLKAEAEAASAPIKAPATPRERATINRPKVDLGARERIMAEAEMSRVERIIFGHRDATGYDKIESLRLRGTMQTDSGELEMIYYFKRPNQFRRELSTGDKVTRVDGFDGDVVWMQVELPDGRQRVTDITGTPEGDELRNSSRLGSYLLEYERHPDRIEFMGMTGFQDNQYHAFRYRSPDGSEVIHHLHPTTLLEQRRILTMVQNGENLPAHIIFGDYREIDEGVTYPWRWQFFINNREVATLLITQAEVNDGVPSFIFDKPKPR